MSRHSLKLFAVVLLSIATTTTAFAADDGNTQPKLSSGSVGGGSGSSPQNIIGTTNGAGNVKGVQCLSPSSTNLYSASISIYVNGGSAQTLALSNTPILLDSESVYYTMFIPMNVRFTSSIRVSVAGNVSGPSVSCAVSWALD